MRVLHGSLMLALVLVGAACAPTASRPVGGTTSDAARPGGAPAASVGAATNAGAGANVGAAANAGAATSAGADASSAAGAAGAAADWQARWEQTLAAARQEGKVVVYGPPGDRIRKNLTEGFQKAYPGLTLELLGGRCAELTARMDAERRAGLSTVDVFMCGTTTANSEMKPAGLLEPIPPALILPEASDGRAWLGNRLEYSDSEGQYNIVFATTPKAHVVYDLRQVKPEDVDELAKLLDPRWKGKIAIGDPIPTGAGQTTFRHIWAALGPDQAPEYYRALRAQAGAVDRDARRLVEWVARGRYAIVVGPNDAVLQQLHAEGLEFGVLSEFKSHGAALSASYGSLMRLTNPPHPAAQVVFINWLLTQEGQTAYSTGVSQASRRLDVPSDHLPPENLLRPDVKYWPAYSEENALTPPAMRDLLRELYGS